MLSFFDLFMSLTSRIAHNTAIQVAGKAISVILGLVSVGLMTRYLDQTGYGQYVTALTFMQFFGILADLGLYIIAVKKISEDDERSEEVFNNIYTLRLVSVLFFVVLAPLTVLLFHYPPIVKLGVLVLALTNLFLSMNQMLIGLYQKSLAMTRAAIGDVIGKTVMLVFVFLLILTHQPLVWFFAVYTLGSAIQFFVSLALARRFLRIRLRYNRALWLSVLEESWPIAVTIALNLIYFRADTIILSLYRPAATVGLYGASYKVLEVLIAFPAMFAGLVLPIVTKHYVEQNHERFQAALQKAFDFLALVALPMVATIFVLAHPIMRLAAGSRFTESGSILRVLIFATGSIFIGNLFGNTVVAVGAQKKMIPIYGIVAAVSLFGYLALIPKYGMWAAAGMTVATELAITLGSFWMVWQKTRVHLALGQFARTLVASFVLALALWWVRPHGLVVALLASAVACPALLVLFGALKKDHIREILPRS